ncbi:cytidine deaminase [Shewanella sp. YIC-542]|uniref:cytidine deaminase n=1 Tax=Shewanella mytili TaxID=3377111 RepID=UPI00398F2EC1
MRERFTAVLERFPSSLQQALQPMLDNHFAGCFTPRQLLQLQQQSALDESSLLFALLPLAAAMSLAPVSGFHVGAIVKGDSGTVYLGTNIELPGKALCHAVHAEQNAISRAWLAGEQRLSDIWINASPCGHCRQFMNELVAGDAINIHLPGQASAPLHHYLPYGFSPADLGIKQPLLATRHIELSCDASHDAVIQQALFHASHSYAPYSQCYCAVVLQTRDGAIFGGRYAENAAFNPSMMPMQMALANLNGHNRALKEISRAVLLASSAGKISLQDVSAEALRAVTDVALEYVTATPVPTPSI